MLQRPQRGAHAGEADDRVQDDVRLARLQHLSRVAADLGRRLGMPRGHLVEG